MLVRVVAAAFLATAMESFVPSAFVAAAMDRSVASAFVPAELERSVASAFVAVARDLVSSLKFPSDVAVVV